jgi:hypothetical protein
MRIFYGFKLWLWVWITRDILYLFHGDILKLIKFGMRKILFWSIGRITVIRRSVVFL